jgi:hypothetical protein
MARKKDSNIVVTANGRRLDVSRHRVAVGTFPGMNRARTFIDRKKAANKKACRGKGDW